MCRRAHVWCVMSCRICNPVTLSIIIIIYLYKLLLLLRFLVAGWVTKTETRGNTAYNLVSVWRYSLWCANVRASITEVKAMDNYELNALVEAISSLRAEQQRTNQLLTDLLQSNWALIEALGEPEQQQEPQYDMDGNRRAVADSQSAHLDMP